MYVSATGATEAENLCYMWVLEGHLCHVGRPQLLLPCVPRAAASSRARCMYQELLLPGQSVPAVNAPGRPLRRERLGLWGRGTAYADKTAFVDMLRRYDVGESRARRTPNTHTRACQTRIPPAGLRVRVRACRTTAALLLLLCRSKAPYN